MNTHKIIAAALSLALVPTSGCSPADVQSSVQASANPAVARVSVAKDNDEVRNKDCWWHQAGATDLTAIWLSPRLDGEVPGGFRFVNLFFHDPKAKSPIAMSAGVGRLRGSDPVALGNSSVRFRVTPKPGRTWGDVNTREDLNVTVERR